MITMPSIGIVTCLNIPEPDVDEAITVDAFRESGWKVSTPAWDDETVDWSKFDLLLPRSTWNYPEYPDDFKHWIKSVAGKIHNPAPALLANLDKSYLFELQAVGIPVVPTALFESNDLSFYFQNWKTDRIVIKPSIGAGSFLTQVISTGQESEALELADEIKSGGARVLVQPFMTAVTEGGERSLIWIDGEFTHRIIKQPRFAGEDESVSEASDPSDDEIKAANHALSKISERLLYARVDLFLQDGELLVNELELIEPSLFFTQKPSALEKLVSATARRLKV